MRGDGEGIAVAAAPDAVFVDAAGLVAGLRHGPYGGAATLTATFRAADPVTR